MSRLEIRVKNLERLEKSKSGQAMVLKPWLQELMRVGSRLPIRLDGSPPLPSYPDDGGALMRFLRGEP